MFFWHVTIIVNTAMIRYFKFFSMKSIYVLLFHTSLEFTTRYVRSTMGYYAYQRDWNETEQSMSQPWNWRSRREPFCVQIVLANHFKFKLHSMYICLLQYSSATFASVGTNNTAKRYCLHYAKTIAAWHHAKIPNPRKW